MPRNLLVTGGVAVLVAIILVVGLSIARTQEGRGVDEASRESKPSAEALDLDVRITRDGFEPKTLRVPIDQIVSWRNESGEPLRIEVAPGQRGRAEVQGLGSRVIEPGGTHAFRPSDAGTFRYRSSADSEQTGVIEVAANGGELEPG